MIRLVLTGQTWGEVDAHLRNLVAGQIPLPVDPHLAAGLMSPLRFTLVGEFERRLKAFESADANQTLSDRQKRFAYNAWSKWLRDHARDILTALKETPK